MNATQAFRPSSARSISPYFILLDLFLFSSTLLGILFSLTFICISASFRSCRSVLNLLSANSCVAGLIFNGVQLSNALFLFRDDISLPSSFDSQFCAMRNYLMHVSGSLLYYSYCVQAISRLFFVVFHKHRCLLTYDVHFFLIAIQWTIALMLPLSMLTSDHIQYQTETSQCFITIKNVSQTLYGRTSMIVVRAPASFPRHDFHVRLTDDNHLDLLHTHRLLRTSGCASSEKNEHHSSPKLQSHA